MKRKAVLMMMLSAVLTLGTVMPVYAAAEEAATEAAYEEADSEDSPATGEGSPQESGSSGSEANGYADSDQENVQQISLMILLKAQPMIRQTVHPERKLQRFLLRPPTATQRIRQTVRPKTSPMEALILQKTQRQTAVPCRPKGLRKETLSKTQPGCRSCRFPTMLTERPAQALRSILKLWEKEMSLINGSINWPAAAPGSLRHRPAQRRQTIRLH